MFNDISYINHSFRFIVNLICIYVLKDGVIFCVVFKVVGGLLLLPFDCNRICIHSRS